MATPRPALAALGLLAACAACCALPLMAGLVAVSSLTAWPEFGALAALAVISLGALLLWRRRRAQPTCTVDPQAPGHCGTAGDCGSGCP
jgi:membrane protein implicated in regulation of membrane protease activity